MVILTRVDAPFLGEIDSLGDTTVAVIDGYVSHDLMESNHPELRLVPYKTIREALDALSVGEIGAFIGNLASASYAINQLGLTNLKVAAHTPYEFELGIGVRKDWPELRSILEKGLASINEEERKAIIRRWIQLQVDKGFNLREILIVAIPIGSGIFVILLVVVIWNRRLQREIIDRQLVEKQLRESEEQLLSSQAIAHIGTWDVDLSSMTMRWSDECFAIHGTSADAYLPAFGTYREFVVDEDREFFLLRTEAVMKGEKHEDSIEYRIKRPDGTIRLLKAYGQLFLNENKQPHRFIGVVHDITDIKLTEQALRDKSQTLQSILDNAPIGIWYQNRDGHPLFVNQDFCNALGIPESKFLSANHYSALFDDEVMQHSIITDAEALSQPGPHSSSEKIKFRDGEFHDLELTKIRTTDENNNVTGLIGLSIDVTDKRKNEALLRKQAYFDELTGLPNRTQLMQQLNKSLSQARRHDVYSALLFFDLDNFKIINDSLGHHAGDELLIEIGERLKNIVREEDTVARLGGDEFVIIASELERDPQVSADQAQQVALKVQEILQQPFMLSEHEHHLTFSIGISMFPIENEDINDILKHADTAMYRAKELGKNRISFFLPSMQQVAEERLYLQNQLRQASIKNQLELVYQPQFNVDHQLIGAESLLRWNHPELGAISPVRFIPLAEESGLIIDIGIWVLREACCRLKQWNIDGIRLPMVSVNVSPRQFHQSDFVDQIKSVIQESEIDPRQLELELTEGILVENATEVSAKIQALKRMGVRFAIDDFGTGYSSLAYLKRMPLDRLKIDQSFVRDITTDTSDALIVETIISMASHLELEVIAEGVEYENELNFLRDKGCLNYQGYYFSKPLSRTDFDQLLNES